MAMFGEKQLKSRIRHILHNKQCLTLLVGSAASMPHNGKNGVPSAKEIVSLIHDLYDENERKDLTETLLANKHLNNDYQIALEYLTQQGDEMRRISSLKIWC